MDVPSDADIGQQVELLEKLHRHPGALTNIERCVKSCIECGTALENYLESISNVYNKAEMIPNDTQAAERRIARVFRDVVEEIKEEKTVLIQVLLPDLSSQIFAIEPSKRGKDARILHAWKDKRTPQEQSTMPVETLGRLLKSLTSLDIKDNAAELHDVQASLWGKNYAKTANAATSSSRRIMFQTVLSGRCKDKQCLTEFLKTWEVLKADVLEHLPDAEGDEIEVFGAGLGFVCGAAGVLNFSFEEGGDLGEVLDKAAKTSLAEGVGGLAQTTIVRSIRTAKFRPWRIIRSNVALGVGIAAVFTIWDLVEWKSNKISTVEFRKRQAASLGGAAGGILGGVGAGVATGLLTLNPIGAVIGGIVGGVFGGIGGAVAGSALDTAVWDASEDAIVESYEFFGWDERRNTHPTKTSQGMRTAYKKKLEDRPKRINDCEWKLYVFRNMTVLMNAMYPDNKKLIEMAAKMRGKHSKGLKVIATSACEQASFGCILL